MQSDPLPWARSDVLDSHPTPNLYFSVVCTDLGLTCDDCERCPFPACLDDIPASRGTGIRNCLNNHIRTWRARVDAMPRPLRNFWLREKIKCWMYTVGLNKCREVVCRQNGHDPDLIDECQAFIAIVTRHE